MAPEQHVSLDYDDLGAHAVAALDGAADPDGYLRRLVDIAWERARALTPIVDARLSVVPGSDQNASAATYSDGSVELSLGFLRDAAFESLCVAEQRTLGFSRQAAHDLPPAQVADPADFVARVRDLDIYDRAHANIDGYVPAWEDLTIFAAFSLARGEPLLDLGSRSRGLAAFGLVEGRIRSGDLTLMHDPGWSAHILRLHHVGIVSLLVFTLVHERGHLVLGHLEGPPDSPTDARRREVGADRFALEHVAAAADLPSALEALGHVHARERYRTDAANLSHPYSSIRLRLLAHALTESPVGQRLHGQVASVLRSMSRPLGTVTFYSRTGSPELQPVETFGDLTHAYLQTRLIEPAATAVADRPQDTALVGCEVVHRGIEDGEVHARAFVAVLFSPRLVTTSQLDASGTTMTHLLTLKLTTPPAWRTRWPNGVLEIASLQDKSVAAERLATTPAQLVTDLLVDDRMAMWDVPESDLLGPAPGPDATAGQLLERMDWFIFFKKFDDALDLGVRVLRSDPAAAGFDHAVGVLTELERLERHQDVVDLGLDYCRRLRILRPKIHLIIGRSAEALGDVLFAHDQYFIDLHGFSDYRDESEIADHPCLQILGRQRTDPVAKTLLSVYSESAAGHGDAFTRWGRNRKAWRLRLAVALLDSQLPERASDMLSVTQLKAECMSQLWRATRDAEVADAATALWGTVTTQHPWWAPGWVQASYFADDQGEPDRARALFREAERIAPRSIQVTQARERFFPQSELERERLEEFWRSFGASHSKDREQGEEQG